MGLFFPTPTTDAPGATGLSGHSEDRAQEASGLDLLERVGDETHKTGSRRQFPSPLRERVGVSAKRRLYLA